MIRRFDRIGWLDSKSFLTRKILFLDLNFWIGLYEQQTDSFSTLAYELTNAVDDNKIICPVSPSLLMEIRKRSNDERRDSYCKLMDRLSSGLSIRVSQATFIEEFQARFAGRSIERQFAYSFFIDAMSTGIYLDFPDGWTEDQATQMANLSFKEITSTTILKSMNMGTDMQRQENIDTLRESWTALAQQAREWRSQNRNATRKEIEDAEFAATVSSFKSQIAKIILESDLQTKLNYSGTNPDQAETLKSCPTFFCQFTLLGAMRAHKETITENDLWDAEHVTTALPYVDCFACDRATRHVAQQIAGLDKRYETKLVSRPHEVLDWLQDVLQ